MTGADTSSHASHVTSNPCANTKGGPAQAREETRDSRHIAGGVIYRWLKLPDGMKFFTWAHEQWPAPRWSVELYPWALTAPWPR